MSSETAPKKSAPQEQAGEIPPIIIDLGKKKRKRVKRLRRGKGPLVDDIMDSIAELRENSEISKDAQPVIVVVREKKKKMKGLPFSLL